MKKVYAALSVLFISFLLLSGPVAAYGIDNPDGYESSSYLPGIDMWINQTTSPGQYAPGQDGLEVKSWELRHVLLVPASVDLSTWIITDPNLEIIVGGFGGEVVRTVDNGFNFGIMSASANEEKTETGLTGFAGRATDGVTQVDANERVAQVDATIIDATTDHFETTATIDAIEQNYTVPENDIDSGVAYEAGDSKSIDDYGTDLADSEGQTLNDVVNATMIGYSYASQDDLQSVVWTYDEETASAPGEGASVFKRARIWLKSKVVKKETNSGFLPGFSSGRTDDINAFRKISLASSALGGRPSGAKFFFSKTIPTGHHPLSKIGTAAVTKSITGRVTGFLQFMLLIGLIILAYFILVKKQNPFKRRR